VLIPGPLFQPGLPRFKFFKLASLTAMQVYSSIVVFARDSPTTSEPKKLLVLALNDNNEKRHSD
jgi:hypothetical protein